ncbi:MAG: hypothetical protein J5902_07390 [Paludibacteraceae bacterium]|nr:hypothetical protein [Paludibacteraceae bacterium]
MKLRALSMTAIAAICLLTTACNTNQIEPSKALPDSAYVYTIDAESNESLMQITYYTYDTRGNLILQYDSIVAIQSPYSASKRKTEMQYNAKEKLVERKESSYSPLRETWENGECQVFEYNEENRLVSEFIYDYFTEPLSNPDKKIFYTWTDDAHATCLAYTHERLSERTEYTYNVNGKIEKAISYSLYGNTEEVLWCTTTYEYDQHGNLTEFAFYDNKGNKKMSDSYKYEYGSDGRILVEWSNFYDDYSEIQEKTKSVFYY